MCADWHRHLFHVYPTGGAEAAGTSPAGVAVIPEQQAVDGQHREKRQTGPGFTIDEHGLYSLPNTCTFDVLIELFKFRPLWTKIPAD